MSTAFALTPPWLYSRGEPRMAARSIGASRPCSMRICGSSLPAAQGRGPAYAAAGNTLVLVTPDYDAVFAWWRPDPTSGIKPMNGLSGWTCSIFRNERGEGGRVDRGVPTSGEISRCPDRGSVTDG